MNLYIIIAIYWVVAVGFGYGVRWLYLEANPVKKLVNETSGRNKSVRTHLSLIFVVPLIMPLFILFLVVYCFKEPKEVGKYYWTLKNRGKSEKTTDGGDDLPF